MAHENKRIIHKETSQSRLTGLMHIRTYYFAGNIQKSFNGQCNRILFGREINALDSGKNCTAWPTPPFLIENKTSSVHKFAGSKLRSFADRGLDILNKYWRPYVCGDRRHSSCLWSRGRHVRMACKFPNAQLTRGDTPPEIHESANVDPILSLLQAMWMLILLGWLFLPVYMACGVRMHSLIWASCFHPKKEWETK